ncbi:CBS domain-containing protein [Dactylosporangium roseum]|uniref:CBS domain-containing protein n=1 Tax=Dactylosporangium roseum TaxID=47989 RepID=A0ABY5Z547_9ACTN|nr:CBS domain-containing protein [Dactylosporangium roseum]UWZ36691.1 CBS domain-containing protein [Dactylosporangium roseum]
MQVHEAMSAVVVQLGPDHTLRQAARLMSTHKVGSAVVADPDGAGVGIITERDILNALGTGLDPDVERTAEHITWEVVYASPTWTIEEAASAMVRGGFRHLVVLDEDDVLGVISVRDIIRVWVQTTIPA